MERATIFFNVDKKITPSWAFPLSPFVYCCQTPVSNARAHKQTDRWASAVVLLLVPFSVWKDCFSC